MKTIQFNRIGRYFLLGLITSGLSLFGSMNLVSAEMVQQNADAGVTWCDACGKFIQKSNDAVFRDSSVSPVKSNSKDADKGKG